MGVMSDDFTEPKGGYGRIWEQMYHGSMVGSGPEVFCVWPYVIANMRLDRQTGQVSVFLNPRALAPVFGCEEEFVLTGIRKLCEPDPATTNGAEQEGRRLIQIRPCLYAVVNGPGYMKLRSKEAHREAQANYAAKKKKTKLHKVGIPDPVKIEERAAAIKSVKMDPPGVVRVPAVREPPDDSGYLPGVEEGQ